MIVVGTRPNFIKITQFEKEFNAHGSEFEYILVHTNQHYDANMSDIFFKQLHLKEPQYLNVSPSSPANQIGQAIIEIEKAVDVAYLMHTTSMKMAMPSVVEQEIAGAVEGISLSYGGPVSFPVILSVDGQTLHNHHHGNVLQLGRMMVTDAGSESSLHYASDITRTVPVGGKFSARQKEIYELVLKANMVTIEAIKPGVYYKDIHLLAARTIAKGLKELGIMKGDTEEIVKQGYWSSS